MKKIFSILAAAVIALSFASCNNAGGGSVDQNGFKITVDSVEATTAHVNIKAADSTIIYGVALYKTVDVAKEDTLKAYLNENVAAVQSLMAMYDLSLEDFVSYEMLYKGVFDSPLSSLPSATELTVIAYELKAAGDSVMLGKYATLKFRTKELKPEKTVALNVTYAEYYIYESYGFVQVALADTAAGVAVSLLLQAKNPNGTFTEDSIYNMGQEIYNFVEWGQGDNDWTPIQKLQMTGSLDAAKKEYSVNGKAIGENLVEYTFNAKATEAAVDANAPAKQAAKQVAVKEAKAPKAIYSSIVK